MQIEEFSLERIQSLYENTVELNLSDSGVHPMTLRELLSVEERETLADIELGYGWTSGSVELREAIAAQYVGRTSDEVLVTNGSAEANFLLVTTLVEPGDEIVVVVPNYMQIAGWARAIGATVKVVPLRESLDWQVDVDELERAVTPRTRLITLCTPNNPTGAVTPLETMHAIVDVAARHGVWLHADEVYRGSEFDADTAPSFADLYPRAIITSGLSKAMALPGLRLGWLVGPAEELAGAWAAKDYTSITTGALSEYIGTLVLQPGLQTKILDRSKRMLRGNLECLSNWLAGQNIFGLCPPRAGGMAFMSFDLPVGSSALAETLRTEDSVLVLPGDVYGMDGYIRLGIGAERHHIEAGLERLGSRAAALCEAA